MKKFLDKESTSALAVVHGIIEDMEIPFILPSAEACRSPTTGVSCPLQPGVEITYRATLPVLTTYPTVKFISFYFIV